jgi:glycogenin glucosyltransferase
MSDSSLASVAGPPLHLRAIVTLVTNDEFVVGAQMLAYSLRKVDTRYPLYILITDAVSTANRLALAESGYRLILVEPLAHANQSHVSSWVDVGYTKLRIWQLEHFERLLYIDADVLAQRNVDHLLSPALDPVSFAAAPDTFPPDHFNAGIMLVRPSRHIFAAMVRRMAVQGSYDGGDTGFLNAFFPTWFAAQSSCVGPGAGQLVIGGDMPSAEETKRSCAAYRRGVARLSFAYNALRTMQWLTKKQPQYWTAIGPIYLLHYCSSPKPWEDLERKRGGAAEEEYFRMMQEWETEERERKQQRSEESHQALIESLPIEFIPSSRGSLQPAPSCLSALQHGKLSAFAALQVMIANNMPDMPLGEIEWEGSGKDDQRLFKNGSAHPSSAAADASSSSTFAITAAEASLHSLPITAFGCDIHTSSGSVRSIRRGVWLTEGQEDLLVRQARQVLQHCLLDSTVSPSSVLSPTVSILPSPVRASPTIPKLIHQIWLGSPLPPAYSSWCASWRIHHPVENGWTYRMWTDEDVKAFPLCERLTDASSAFLSAHLKSLLPRCTSPAQLSDLLRLDILWTLGGLYVDTDFECLASFDPFHTCGAWSRHVQFYTCFSNVGVVECNNGLVAATPQCALVGKMIQSVDLPMPTGTVMSTKAVSSSASAGASSFTAAAPTAHSEKKHTPMQIITSTGPGHFTRTIAKYLEDWAKQHRSSGAVTSGESSPPPPPPRVLLLPTQVCYPLPNSMRQLTSPSDKALFLTPATFAVHHWSCSWQDQAGAGSGNTSKQSTSEDARSQERKAEANANQLVALAEAVKKVNIAKEEAKSDAPQSSAAAASSASSAAALNPLLLGKIAAFLKQ